MPLAQARAAIKRLPKVDLHRHLAGSITASAALDVAARYDVRLTQAETSELVRTLSGEAPVRGAKEYFAPWTTLRKLFASLDAVRDLIQSVVREAAQDNVVYMELRLSARALVDEASNNYTFKDYVGAVAEAVADATDVHGVAVRCVLGVSRRAFGGLSESVREQSFERLFSSIASHPVFAGVDLPGAADVDEAPEYEPFFREAKKRGLGITIHAGEPGGSGLSVAYAVRRLSATRIGHGIAAASCADTMALLAERGCTLEICPTSNVLLGAIGRVSELPLNTFEQRGVRYVICTDNPARCSKSLSRELAKVARSFDKSIDNIAAMMLQALEASFADEATKARLREKLKPGAARFEQRSTPKVDRGREAPAAHPDQSWNDLSQRRRAHFAASHGWGAAK